MMFDDEKMDEGMGGDETTPGTDEGAMGGDDASGDTDTSAPAV